MKTLDDRPLRVASEPYPLHLFRLCLWISELRLVPHWEEGVRDPFSVVTRQLFIDGMTWGGKLLVLIALLILLLSFRNDDSFYLSSAALALGLVVWARLLGALYRPRVSAERSAPAFAEVGAALVSKLRIRNLGTRPVSNFAVREMRARGSSVEPEWRLAHHERLLPGASQVVNVACTPKARGMLRLNGAVVQSYYPFFLTRASQRLALPVRIPVLPKSSRRSLPSLRQLAEQTAAAVNLGNAKGGRERVLNYVSSRPFQRGDSIRRLDQRASSRLGEPMTKVYDGTELIKPEGLALIVDTGVDDFPAWKRHPDDPQVLDRRLALAVDLQRRGTAEGLALKGVYWGGQWQTCPDLSHFHRQVAQIEATHSSPLPGDLAHARWIYALVVGKWLPEMRERVRSWRQSGLVILVFLLPEAAGGEPFPTEAGYFQFGHEGGEG